VTTRTREFDATEAALGARELIEYCYDRGWTDGLPVVPPIREFVDEFLAHTARAPDEVLMVQPHLDRTCTVRQAAINAVMAGCRPEYFPVVLAAVDAFEAGTARTNLLQSTTGQALVTVVNGPVRARLGFNCTGNVFGSGHRPNATVGRALRLIGLNALGIRPHEFDQSTHGTSAKYACCLGENEEDSPWEPLHVEHGFAASESVVTVQLIRSDVYVEHRSTQEPEEILATIADSLSYGGMITQVTDVRTLHGALVVLGPEHAHLIARRGWSKPDVKRFLFERFGKTKRELRRMGKLHPDLEGEDEDAFIRSAASPDSLVVIVAGANNAGVSTVCPSITIGRTPLRHCVRAIEAS
jgi:hypothetical protein